MKLNGSLDSEEPSTESEKSECSTYRKRQSKRKHYRGAAPYEVNSINGSLCEDESSVSSFGGSDHGPAYEEIPTGVADGCRCLRLSMEQAAPEKNYMNLPSPLPYLSENPQFRKSSPYLVNEQHRMESLCSSSISSQYKESDIVIPENDHSICSSIYSNCDKECHSGSVYLNSTDLESVEDAPSTDRITDVEKHQIETFFRGLRTDLFVSSSLANLYVSWKDVEGKWSFKHTGIPVILLDRGDTKSRRKKKIQILLAERGTCFPLWKDTIDNLTSYRKAGEAFHTMHLSSDHRQIIGLSFDFSEDSDQFFNYVNELTSNPENINISVPGLKKNKKSSSKKPLPLPHKEQISNPCLFEHVTSVAAKDRPMYTSLQTLLDKELIEGRETDRCCASNRDIDGIGNWRSNNSREGRSFCR